jgi:hypothetical protein
MQFVLVSAKVRPPMAGLQISKPLLNLAMNLYLAENQHVGTPGSPPEISQIATG